jgi:O-antigen/teichoic acid export membrane protein
MFKKISHITLNNSDKLIVLFDQGLVSGTNFTISILLARYLGVDKFGLFAFTWMLVLFVSSLHLAFIISPLYTLYPKHRSPINYLKGVHSIQLLYSSIVYVLAYVIISVVIEFKPEWAFEGILFSLPLVAALFVLQDFYRRINFTLKKPSKSLLSDGIAYGCQPIVIIAFHYLDILSIHHVLLSMSVLFGISIAYNFFQQHLTFNLVIIKNTILENWSFSKYLVGTALLQWVSGNFFIVVAGGLLGPVAIGAIRIAQNVVGVLHVLFSAMENIIPIKAAEILQNKGELKALSYFKQMLLQGGGITLFILVIIAITRNQIIALCYGEEYMSYVNLLLGFTGLYVLVFIGTILGFVIRTFEMNKIFLWSYIVSTLFSVLSAKIIISQVGIYGVILGLLITQIINIVFYVSKLNTKLKILWK